MTGVRLGAFRLVRPIAEGGMGQVWGALHGEDTPVAVKVLTGGAAWDPSYRSLFRNEVRAAARLNHTGIISVLDHGEVGPEAARASNGSLVSGTPYLVMEFASGGPLGKRKRRWNWSGLRRLMNALLEALAHAHARGVVHRDLKPSNILLAGPDDLRGGVKLSDFGIAWVGEHEKAGASEHAFAGTLQYMAPEQHSGDSAAYGPWTDLYALGIVAWRIAAGRTPFAEYSGRGVARAHLFKPPPPLAPRFDLPPEFEAWVRILLHKDPGARFACAADARAALKLVGQVDEDDLDDGGSANEEDAPTVARTDSSASGGSSGTPSLGSRTPTDEVPSQAVEGEIAPTTVAELPVDWRLETPFVPLKLRGAGLGLFELREMPIVGRSTERDALWRALRATDRTGRPRVVLLRGPAGVGKTRLVDWLVCTAHEVAGIPTVLIRDDDLPRALAEHLQVARLDEADRPEALTDRLRRCPSPDLPRALLEAMGHRSSSAERHGATRALLEWRSANRPALLVVEDAHAAPDALELAHHVLSAPTVERRAVVVVIVVRDEDLAANKAADRRINEIVAASKGGRVLALGQLGPDDRRTMLSQLGLSGPLAARLDERTGGNPLFSSQLVGNLIQQDLLELGPDGFTLRRGAELVVPAGLHAVWVDRLERLLAPLGEIASIHLERAAAFGMEVDEAEWLLACGAEDDEDTQRICATAIGEMLDARLAREVPRGFVFVHAMLREALAQRARKAGRWKMHHMACVRVLREDGDPNPARIGRHLHEADKFADAIGPLLAGFGRELARRGVHAANALVLPCQQSLERANVPTTDLRWAQLWKHRATLLALQGQPKEAMQVAERAGELAAKAGDEELWAEVQLGIASVQEQVGSLDEAVQTMKSATARLLRAGRRGTVLADLLQRMASIARTMNHLDDAERWASQGQAILIRLDADPSKLGAALMELGIVASRRRQFDRALDLYEEAAGMLGERTAVSVKTNLDNNRGDALMKLGRWADAEANFARAGDALEAVGRDRVIPDLNLVLCRMHQGRYELVADVIERLEHGTAGRAKHLVALVSMTAAVWCAATGDWRGFGRRYPTAAEGLRNAGFVDPDLAFLLAHAAGHAERAEQRDHARALWQHARQQCAELQDDVGLAHADARLAALEKVR